MQDILKQYELKKTQIKSRLNDFEDFYKESESWFYENNSMILKPVEKNFSKRIFEELAFCLLTANTSAKMSMKAIDSIRNVIDKGSYEDIQEGLVKSGYRYPNVRAKYIIEARNEFADLLHILSRIEDRFEKRNYLARSVKGLGYKESSHFLRNIGVKGLAILDKHILRTLFEHNIIKEIPKSLNKKRYSEVEQKYLEFATQLKINPDELDLLLWSMKTGEINK